MLGQPQFRSRHAEPTERVTPVLGHVVSVFVVVLNPPDQQFLVVGVLVQVWRSTSWLTGILAASDVKGSIDRNAPTRIEENMVSRDNQDTMKNQCSKELFDRVMT
jgi:hypothetical protein